MSRAWEPLPLPLDRADVVLGLERLVYGEAAEVAEPAFYDWLYRRNPSGEALVWHAATGDPRCPSAGQVVLVPLRFRVAGTAGVAGLALNVVTHPEHRRQGVFAALAAGATEEAERRGMLFTWALPNPNSYPGFLRLGYTDVGRVPLLLCPLEPSKLDPGGGAAWRLAVRAGARAIRAVTRPGHRRAAAAIVEEVPPDWEGWDALWRRLEDKYPVMVVRDRAHLSWRFGECPTRRYRLYLARIGGEPAGFIATRLATVAGMSAGLVVDLLVVAGRGNEAGSALVERAFEEFRGAATGLAASLMLPHAEEHACLRAAGFLPCPRFLEPQPFRVVFKSRGPSPARELSAWFLTMADYDVV